MADLKLFLRIGDFAASVLRRSFGAIVSAVAEARLVALAFVFCVQFVATPQIRAQASQNTGAQPASPASSASLSSSSQDAPPTLVPDPPAPPEEAGTEAMFPHFKSTRFWLSGQANFIFQALPSFSAPYSGPAQPWSQLRKSHVARDDALHGRAAEQFHRIAGGY